MIEKPEDLAAINVHTYWTRIPPESVLTSKISHELAEQFQTYFRLHGCGAVLAGDTITVTIPQGTTAQRKCPVSRDEHHVYTLPDKATFHVVYAHGGAAVLLIPSDVLRTK